MKEPELHYWRLRMENCAAALENNGFEVHLAATARDAADLVMDTIVPAAGPRLVSWGGSKSLMATGLVDQFKRNKKIKVLDTFNKKLSPDDKIELRRQALLTDLFLTGTNAITEDGKLVNLDMHGNRVAALAFGPRNVVVIAGRNKIVADVDDAMFRVKDYAAPVNAMRLDMKTPCVKSGACEDCKAPQRICNVWTINEKSFPRGRIKVVLVNQDLGF